MPTEYFYLDLVKLISAEGILENITAQMDILAEKESDLKKNTSHIGIGGGRRFNPLSTLRGKPFNTRT